MECSTGGSVSISTESKTILVAGSASATSDGQETNYYASMVIQPTNTASSSGILSW